MSHKINNPFLWGLVLSASIAIGKGMEPFKANQVQPSGLSQEQAKQVLLMVLKHERYKIGMRGVFIDGNLTDNKGNPPHPGYFDFSLGYDNPRAGATDYMGLFSVSTMTGDVWEINICKRFSFTTLKRLQAKIMEKTGKTMEGESIQRRGLGCPDGE